MSSALKVTGGAGIRAVYSTARAGIRKFEETKGLLIIDKKTVYGYD